MAGNDFSFKQFVIRQDKCGMKVGTDGVLLGAWANGGKRILDIGTGTGILALMMAQRFPNAYVDAIDIDEDACLQAKENAEGCPFGDRVHVYHAKLQSFETSSAYDCIISNPPFFTNGQRSCEPQRALARHADTLPYPTLFKSVKRLLTEDGEFSAIIPYDNLSAFTEEAYYNGFSIVRQCTIKTTREKAPRRCLIAFSARGGKNVEKEEAVLQTRDGQRTDWYNNQTKNFYIK